MKVQFSPVLIVIAFAFVLILFGDKLPTVGDIFDKLIWFVYDVRDYLVSKLVAFNEMVNSW